MLDAAYAEYVDAPDYEPGVALVDAGDNTVMTRTFSKMFGLGGMRLGWAYAPAAVVDVLNRVRGPFNVNAPAQAAGIAALAEPGWVETRPRATTANGAPAHRARSAHAGIKVWPSEGNFLLADFGSDRARRRRADAGLRAPRHHRPRASRGYGLPHCLRITIGTDEECAAVADALADFMAHDIGAWLSRCSGGSP